VSFADGVKLLKELTKGGADAEDPRWQLVYDILYRGGLERSKFRFVERYLNDIIVFHFHGTLVNLGRMDRLIEFCATLEHGHDSGTTKSSFSTYCVPSRNAGNSGIQMSMLVDVREYAQHPEKFMPVVPSIVRLQPLNECKCLMGNTVWDDAFSEKASRDGRSSMGISGGIQGQREHNPVSHLVGDGAIPVPLDKIEKNVVERRPELIDDFASEYGNLDRGLLGDLQCWCTLRLGDFSIRVSAAIFGNALFDRLILFHCPNDFRDS
jgi:hypothetical protein